MEILAVIVEVLVWGLVAVPVFGFVGIVVGPIVYTIIKVQEDREFARSARRASNYKIGELNG